MVKLFLQRVSHYNMKVESTWQLAKKRRENQTEMKPHQSNALHSNKIGLGKIRDTQARVRPRRAKSQNMPRIDVLYMGVMRQKGGTLISRVEYEFWPSVGYLQFLRMTTVASSTPKVTLTTCRRRTSGQ